MAYWKKESRTGISEESFIHTDTYKTKDLIWEAYYGFKENYNEYFYYKNAGRSNNNAKAGMIRYALDFYFQTRNFYHDIKQISQEDINQVDSIIKDINNNDLEEWTVIRLFFEDFMHKSGIKNIIRTKEEYVAANNETE